MAANRAITVRVSEARLRKLMRARRVATQSELINTLVAEEEERLRSYAVLRETARTVRARDVVAIEIKAARQVTPADTKGLLSLAGLVGRRRPLALWLAFRGERAQRFDSGVEALPVLEALRRLAAE